MWKRTQKVDFVSHHLQLKHTRNTYKVLIQHQVMVKHEHIWLRLKILIWSGAIRQLAGLLNEKKKAHQKFIFGSILFGRFFIAKYFWTSTIILVV